MDKFEQQAGEYEFPYHYIPTYTANGFCRTRSLFWGGEYLAYMKYVVDNIETDKAKNVLDVGCGDGRLCNILAEHNSIERIKGIDLVDKAINWAKMFNPSLEFATIDVKDEAEVWDAITCVEVIEHIPDDSLPDFFNNMQNCLADEGRIYLTVPSINLPLQSKHYRHYSVELLESQLKESGADLEIEEFAYIVPKKTTFDKVMKRLFYNNKGWKFAFFDDFEWKRLWRNGLVSDSRTGLHLYAKLRRKK